MKEELLLSRMISLLLNYPSIAHDNDTVEVRVLTLKKKDKKFATLLDLVHSAEEIEDVSQKELLKPFKSKIVVYDRLQQLCTLVPFVSENQAKYEFLDALLKLEGQQKNAQFKDALASLGIDNPTDEQLKIMKGIQKGTYNNIIEDEKEYVKNLQARRGKNGTYNNIEDELDERYVTEEWALGRIKDEKEWADDRVRDAIEDVEKEANRGFIAFLLVGLMILLFLSAAM